MLGKVKDYESSLRSAEAQVSYYLSLQSEEGDDRVALLEAEVATATNRLETLKNDIKKAPKMVAIYQAAVRDNTRKLAVMRESGSTFEPLTEKEKGLRKLKKMKLEIEELEKEVLGHDA